MKNENANTATSMLKAKPFRYGILSFMVCFSITMVVGLYSSIAIAIAP